MKRLAETRSTSDAATCATTRLRRIRALDDDAVTDAAEALSAASIDAAEVCSAGARPNASALTAVTSSVKPSTRAPSGMSKTGGIRIVGISVVRQFDGQYADDERSAT